MGFVISVVLILRVLPSESVCQSIGGVIHLFIFIQNISGRSPMYTDITESYEVCLPS
jgi:hypothetical protein